MRHPAGAMCLRFGRWRGGRDLHNADMDWQEVGHPAEQAAGIWCVPLAPIPEPISAVVELGVQGVWPATSDARNRKDTRTNSAISKMHPLHPRHW